MPVDPFFTSAHKKHYIENPETGRLIKQLRSLPVGEAYALIDQWRKDKMDAHQIMATKVFLKDCRRKRRILIRRHQYAMMNKLRGQSYPAVSANFNTTA
jgi:hypothetical protein